VRIVPQISLLSSKPDDRTRQTLPNGFLATPADPPGILWGGSIGVAAISSQNFVLAPGLMFLRTEESAYGSFLGINLPFDWVTESGARIGFVVAVGRGFGGSVRGTCPGFASECDPGEIREFNRDGASAFYSHFHIGWGAGHPDPDPPPR
jgi:hypothetical protein